LQKSSQRSTSKTGEIVTTGLMFITLTVTLTGYSRRLWLLNELFDSGPSHTTMTGRVTPALL